jgi:hypothetical protein
MRHCLAILLVSSLQMSGCDLTGGPTKVQLRTESQLRQYFPNAHASAFPEQGTIVAVTCTHGLGKPVIEEIAKYLENARAIQQFQRARNLPLKLSPYRCFRLEFDEYYIQLDADTKQHWVLPSDHEVRDRYKMSCGMAPSAPT